MQKIMFNDTYGLTRAAIAGTKPMTRRSVPDKWQQPLTEIFEDCNFDYSKFWNMSDVQYIMYGKARYNIGEIVAIAQNYGTVLEEMIKAKGGYGEEENEFFEKYQGQAGWNNKMFVIADLMPHRIRITDVKVERLQDITDEDCLKEGIEEDSPYYWVPVNRSLPNWRKIVDSVSDMYPNDRDGKVYPHFLDSPKKAFAALIDKVSGRGTWESNPWVFAYSFELIK